MDKEKRTQNDIANFDYVRLSSHNLHGTSTGHMIPQRNVQEYLHNGLDMYEGVMTSVHKNPRVPYPPNNQFQCKGVMTYDASGKCIPFSNAKAFNYGNMIMRPDLDTLRPVPWLGSGKYKVAEILCESLWRRDKTPHDACPRYAARKLLQTLDTMGFQLLSGVEVEFSVLKGDTLEPVHQSFINSCTEVQSEYSALLFDFDKMLFEAGINVERIYSEGLPGLFEFVLPPKLGIAGPDTTVTVKQGLLEMAKLKGFKISFLRTLSLDHETASGHHFNFSFLETKTNRNLFYDVDAPDNLSIIARKWIAGILKHSKALRAFTAPTPNCYRGSESVSSVSHIYWDIENRSALLRVKNHGPSQTFIENRLPSSLSNPYLVFAATVAAGLDGMNGKLDLPPPGLKEDTERLPSTLAESLNALENDTVLTELMGEELVSTYIKCKRSDLRRFEGLTTDEERFQLERELFL